MKISSQTAGGVASDAALVALCRRGERDAFATIVLRYEALVCALAFSACGSVPQSEDIAQDVFVSAWRQIGRLREPEKLKSWLCGITRQTAVQSYRRERREPAYRARELVNETTAGIERQPAEQAFLNEEESILWRALERLDETYREALVLYYRQHQSIGQVAAALDLSEEAVRQRLSRGRKALQEEVLKVVEGTLVRSNPGPAFRGSVMAALPVAAVGNAAMASALKGGLVIKGVVAVGYLLANFASPLVGMSAQLYAAESPQERRWVLRNWLKLLGSTVVYIGTLYVLRYHPPASLPLLVAWLTGVTVAYLLILGLFLRDWTKGWEDGFARPFCGALGIPSYEYRSSFQFLGLPLIHLRSGPGPDGHRLPAKGWIAVGRTAYGGIFAGGAVAVAPIAMGAVSAGILSVGGIGLGVLAFGGLAGGMYALGAIALGYCAQGGIAAGWYAVIGGIAWAYHYAGGGLVAAQHANDRAAKIAINSLCFFRHGRALFTVLISCCWLPMVAISLFRRLLRRA